MHIVYEVRKPFAFHGHNFREFLIDQIELAAIEPKASTVPAVVQEDIVGFQKPDLIQDEIVASRALPWLGLGFLVLVFFAEFDASLNLESHLVQLASVEPKAATLFAHVVGKAVLLRDHLVVGHLGAAV
jgi:hypothetical protein